MASSLIENFKFSVKLACFGGLYVPGAENLFRFKKIMKIFFRINFYACVCWINFQVVQLSYCIVHCEAMPTSLKIYFPFALITIDTVGLRLMALRWKENETEKIVEMWDRSFKDSLFPDSRKEELKIMRARIERIGNHQIAWFFVPMIVWPFAPIVTGKELLINSFPGDHDASPAFELIFVYHLFLAYYIAIGWIAFDTFYFLIMGSILVELNHLKKSLKKIFSILQCNQKGEIFYIKEEIKNEKGYKFQAEENQDFELYKENMDRVENLLEIWILHYSELIKYSDTVRKFYAPILLGQFTYLAVYGCATLYMSLVAELELENVFATIGFYSNSYLVTYVMCSFANEIYDKSLTMTEEVFGQDWMFYPKNIRQSLQIIITITTQRPIGIHVFNVLKINVKAFEKLLQLTYSFLAFMAQVRGKLKV